MRFVVLGRTEWLVAAARACAAAGHEPALVVTSRAEAHYAAGADSFERLARDLGCPYVLTQELSQAALLTQLEAAHAEIAISVNWPTLIGADVRRALRFGVVNAHAGDLPRYRGNAAPNWALIAGESEVVLTLHVMDDGIDTGPVLLKRSLPIGATTTVGEIYQRIEAELPAAFAAVLAGLEAGTLAAVPQPQAPEASLRGLPRLPRDSELDWSASAVALDRLVRASSEPFGGAGTYLDGARLVVWRAHVEQAPAPLLGTPGQVVERRRQTGEVAVLTGDGLLVLEAVQLAGGRRLPAAEVIRSNRARLGLDVVGELERMRARVAELELRLAQPDDPAGCQA